MDQLTLIALLESQIQQEITRLKNSSLINEEKETARLAIYQNLVHHV